jgi:hypothetical protein
VIRANADIWEIVVQARHSVAALATGVAMAHLATASVTLLTLREARATAETAVLNV